MFWFGLGIGLVVGACAGILVMALCIANKDDNCK